MAEARETENPPVYPQTDATHVGIGRGITLRDYFAAAALTGMCANALLHESEPSDEDFAAWSYRLAGAMLDARGGR